MYELRCMGDISLRDPTGKAIGFRSRKHLALLIYLAVNGERAHRRERLASLLWSDSDTSKARHSLSQALYAVRRRVDGTVRIEGDTIQLDPSRIYVDSVELERHLKAGDYASAVDSYGGEFLEGFFVRRAQGFEDWLERERSRVGALAREALRGAIQLARERSDWSVVRSHGQKLVRLDPYDESAYAELMRSLWMLGDRAGALELYDDLKRVLKSELGTRPSSETSGLADRIRKLSIRGGWRRRVLRETEPERFSDPPFVGRKKELGTLACEWEHVLRGETRAVALVGEAGIGKSRLATEFIKSLAIDDVQVLKGRCYEVEQVLPYGPVAEAFREALRELDLSAVNARWLAELARIVPEVAERYPDLPKPPVLEAEGSRRRLYEGIAQVLRELCEQRPLLFFVDDVHWADESSLSLLHYLLRRVSNGMYLVLASRNDEPGALGHHYHPSLLLEGHKAAMSVEITPLNDSESAALVSTLLGGSASDQDLTRMARGNPFFTIELAQAHILSNTKGEPREYPSLPTSIKTIIERRYETLGPRACGVAEQAAVFGAPLSWPALAEATDIDLVELTSLVRELVNSGVISPTNERVGFRHDLIRSYVYDYLGTDRRQLLHRRAARALMRTEGDPGEIARHFSASGDRGKAYAFALHAAHKAERMYALDETAGLLQLAIDNAPSEKAANRVSGRLGLAYAQLRRYRLARPYLENYMAASEVGNVDNEMTYKCRFQLLVAATESGDTRISAIIRPLFQLHDQLLARGQNHCTDIRLDILSKIFWASLRSGNRECLKALTQRIRLHTRRSAGDRVLWRAYRILGIHECYRGNLKRAQVLLRKANESANRADEVLGQLESYIGLSVLVAKSIDTTLAQELLAQCREPVSACGDPARQAILLSNCAIAFIHHGDLKFATSCLNEASECLDSVDECIAIRASIDFNRGYIAFLSGSPNSAEDYWERTFRISSASGLLSLQSEALAGLALVYLQRRKLQKARNTTARALKRARKLDFRYLDSPFLLEESLARLRLLNGNDSKALARLAEIERRAQDRDIALHRHAMRLRHELSSYGEYPRTFQSQTTHTCRNA